MSNDKIAEIRAQHDAVYDDRLETVWRVGLAMRNSVQEIKFLRAEAERLHRAHQAACEAGDLLRATLLAEVERLARQRDEARAEVLRLRTGLHRISLASHNSMSSREECGRIAREALRDALDGLRYRDPQTSAGAVERSRITEKGTEALEAKS